MIQLRIRGSFHFNRRVLGAVAAMTLAPVGDLEQFADLAQPQPGPLGPL